METHYRWNDGVSYDVGTAQATLGALADETIAAEAMEPDHQGIGSPRARD